MKATWKNWSESVVCHPAEMLYPSSEEEIVNIIKTAKSRNQKIRVVGSGHSFSPLVETDQTLISLDRLKGLIYADKEKLEAEVFAGTKLYDLGPILHQEGLALENMGDVDKQSVAGAFSTSTHGSGINFGILSTQVLAITLINGEGEIVRLEKELNGDEFKAAQVSLGMLGIITRMKLKLLTSYKLNYVVKKANFDDTLASIDKYNAENRNYEFYWFPNTDMCQQKFINTTNKETSNELLYKWNSVVLENYGLKLMSEFSRIFSAPVSTSKVLAAGVSKVDYTNWSYKVFVTVRMVKFQEMEFNIPREHFKAALREIREMIEEKQIKVHFPIECRFVKEDNILLSPAYQRESSYIAVHMYKGMEYETYFTEVQKIMEKYNGRPHWGKMHFCSKEYFQKQYPMWNTFNEIRKKHDPQNMFLNEHLSALFN